MLQPPTEWASTETGLKQHNGVTAVKKTVTQIVGFVQTETKIRFQLRNSQCKGNTMISQALAGLTKVYNTIIIAFVW